MILSYLPGKKLKTVNKDILDIIIKYGKSILCSEEFLASFSQKHHMGTTVGDHTLGVTAEAVRICLTCSITDDITLENTVVASLCHDLGILGREEKFKNNVQCLIQHPIDSVDAYRALTGDENERILDAIKCHMFPLKLRMPGYKEGWVLVIADKTASIREKLGCPAVTLYDREMIIKAAGSGREQAV